MVLWVVFNYYLERVEHGHAPGSGLVELVADAVFEERDVDVVAAFGNAGFGPEAADGRRWVPQAAQAAQGVEPRIVPTGYEILFDELQDVSFGEDGVGDVAARVLDLARGEDAEFFDEPVVERSVVGKFV